MFKECRHIRASGIKCHSPAIRDSAFCYYHTSLRRSNGPKSKFDDLSLKFPALEDSSAIQIALSQVLGRLASSDLEPRRAGLLLYGLQIAAQFAARPSTFKPSDVVRTVCYEGLDDILAPEKIVCEPPGDCIACEKRDTCENNKPDDDEEDEEDDKEAKD